MYLLKVSSFGGVSSMAVCVWFKEARESHNFPSLALKGNRNKTEARQFGVPNFLSFRHPQSQSPEKQYLPV